jgi:RDD family protein
VSHKHLLRGQAPPGKGRLPGNAPAPKAAGLDTRAKSLLLTPVLLVATLGIGWLAWSVAEWRHGSTPSYRRTGLRVVRLSDGRPIGLWRSVLRELCVVVLLLPTLVVCSLLGLAFVMGASPPDGLLRKPRAAPWDVLTRTEVVDEFGRARGRTKLKLGEDWPIDPSPALVRRSGEKWRQN